MKGSGFRYTQEACQVQARKSKEKGKGKKKPPRHATCLSQMRQQYDLTPPLNHVLQKQSSWFGAYFLRMAGLSRVS